MLFFALLIGILGSVISSSVCAQGNTKQTADSITPRMWRTRDSLMLRAKNQEMLQQLLLQKEKLSHYKHNAVAKNLLQRNKIIFFLVQEEKKTFKSLVPATMWLWTAIEQQAINQIATEMKTLP